MRLISTACWVSCSCCLDSMMFRSRAKRIWYSQLAGRTARHQAKASQFGIALSTATFGYIRRDRRCGTAHLGRQAIGLITWKSSCHRVDRQRQLMRPVPYLELSEVFQGNLSSLMKSFSSRPDLIVERSNNEGVHPQI